MFLIFVLLGQASKSKTAQTKTQEIRGARHAHRRSPAPSWSPRADVGCSVSLRAAAILIHQARGDINRTCPTTKAKAGKG